MQNEKSLIFNYNFVCSILELEFGMNSSTIIKFLDNYFIENQNEQSKVSLMLVAKLLKNINLLNDLISNSIDSKQYINYANEILSILKVVQHFSSIDEKLYINEFQNLIKNNSEDEIIKEMVSKLNK